jgi:hypothetical protein
MTTPSGQISLSQVNEELDVSPTSTTINMGSAPVRALAEVPSGAITMANLQGKSNAQFIVATGGSIATSGDFKIHTFNSSDTFNVTAAGNAAGSNTVDFLVIAGGGGGGAGANQFRGSREPIFKFCAGGGGAGGNRERTEFDPVPPGCVGCSAGGDPVPPAPPPHRS